MNVKRAFLLLTFLLPTSTIADDILTIAVASNFRSTANKIVEKFSESTGIDARVSAGSTGKLYAQIVNGAPYDVFLAADTERPHMLHESGLAIAESFFVYATGYLVLWSNHPRYAGRDCLKELRQGNVSFVAIANPGTAPYGAAAQKFLEDTDIWFDVKDKLVFGENISQTFQFVASGSASMGLVAASQIGGDVHHESTCQQVVSDESLSPYRINQAGVVITKSKNIEGARRFMRFLRAPEIRLLLQKSGYTAAVIATDGEQ